MRLALHFVSRDRSYYVTGLPPTVQRASINLWPTDLALLRNDGACINLLPVCRQIWTWGSLI